MSCFFLPLDEAAYGESAYEGIEAIIRSGWGHKWVGGSLVSVSLESLTTVDPDE